MTRGYAEFLESLAKKPMKMVAIYDAISRSFPECIHQSEMCPRSISNTKDRLQMAAQCGKNSIWAEEPKDDCEIRKNVPFTHSHTGY